MVEERRSVKELVSGLEVFPQMMINVKVKSGSPGAAAIIDSPTVKNAVERVEKQIAGEGRVVLRASGTEPVIRVMVEGRKQKEVSELADQLAAAVDSASSTSPS